MGVSKRNRDILFSNYNDNETDGHDVIDDLGLDDVIIAHSSEDELAQDAGKHIHARKVRERHMAKMKRYNNFQRDVSILRISQDKMGCRRARRVENLRRLLNYIDKDEVEDFSLNSLIEPCHSKFAELFMEHEKMKIWNDFMNRSEEEQERILSPPQHERPSKPKMQNKDKDDNKDKDTADNTDEVVRVKDASLLDSTWEEIPDLRAGHPAYSAEDCFNNIDQKLKRILRSRNLSKGIVADFENDLTAFFLEWPNSVYVSEILSSYERLLLHAVSQYLHLFSTSCCEDGQKRAQVENREEQFYPPEMKLVSYLESMS